MIVFLSILVLINTNEAVSKAVADVSQTVKNAANDAKDKLEEVKNEQLGNKEEAPKEPEEKSGDDKEAKE